MSVNPQTEYTLRLERKRELVSKLERSAGWLAHARILLFAALVVLAALAVRQTLSGLWCAAALVGFLLAVARHTELRGRQERAQRAAEFYEKGLARLRGEFSGGGSDGAAFIDEGHPYASHLDVLGPGSLFELLCRAQTAAGEQTLARWLLEPAAPDQIGERQTAVAELNPLLELREDLAILGPEVRTGASVERMREWAEAPRRLGGRLQRLTALGLALAVAGSAAVAWLGWTKLGPLFVALAAVALFGSWYRTRVRHVMRETEAPARDLELLAVLLARLEAEAFTSPRLVRLRAALDVDGEPPSEQVARLRRLLALLDARRNQLFAPLAPLLLWTTQLAFALEGWRAHCGERVGPWVEAVGELEALCSLASHAYEHPDDPFPELSAEGPLLDAHELRHPLVPAEVFVPNDVHLDRKRALLVVSGSNMSGKSTLLRSVGANTILALCGSVVRARRFSVSPLQLGASLRVQDSLLDGRSRFYAEITGLKRVVDLAEVESAPPLLFLLDELLAGTNSHDRRIGADALLRGLVERGAIGLVTTHDLALTQIADELDERAANVHFADELRAGTLHFDHRLRDGVVQHSNALELMRTIGLQV
jgi:hypothetical protein